MPQRASVFCNFYIRVDREALVSERALDVGSVAFKAMNTKIVIYERSAGRRCSRMSAFFKARATKERVPLINSRMNGRCLHASGSYNIFCTKIKLNFFVLIH
jgi:hypothetical protein